MQEIDGNIAKKMLELNLIKLLNQPTDVRRNGTMAEFTNSQKPNDLIEKIILLEWDMFQKVNNINGRASCQDEWGTFHIMRYSHYSAWTDEMINSYLEDLEIALKTGRNLVMEKYAYMMEFTQNAYYKSKLEPYLPKVSDEALQMIKEITQYNILCEKEISLKYPNLSKAGRSIETSSEGSTSKDTTVEVYATGELKTYSLKTLRLYLNYIRENKAKKINVVLPVKDMMVQLSGYTSLEDAEGKL